MPNSRSSVNTREPTHPGAVLREDVLPALDLSVAEAARRLGISRQMLHDLLAERRGFSAGMALRIGKLAGNGPGFWLSMQQAYDLWHEQKALGRVLARIVPAPSRFGVNDESTGYRVSRSTTRAALKSSSRGAVARKAKSVRR